MRRQVDIGLVVALEVPSLGREAQFRYTRAQEKDRGKWVILKAPFNATTSLAYG